MTDVANPRKAAPGSVAAQLIEQARAEGVSLVGPGSPLAALTKQVLETALEAELDEHLGYEHGDRDTKAGAEQPNERNGTRAKTVHTELGPVSIEVPRDRHGSFEPLVVRKRQRRLSGVDAMVLSLSAKGLTSGEICAFFADTYGQAMSKDTISCGLLPRVAPQRDRGRVAGAPLVGELVEPGRGRLDGRGRVHRLDVAGDGVPVLPGGVLERVTQQVHVMPRSA